MATNFPGSLDSFTNPTSGSTLDSPSHASQHANINDAMEAVQAKLGTGAGTIGEWTDWTANFRSQTGAYTSVSTTYARYTKVNNLIIARAFFVIVNHAGGTGSAEFDLPVTAAANYANGHSIGTGRENAVNGYTVNVFTLNTTEAHIRFYNNGAAESNNFAFGIVFAYEAA